MLTKLWRFLFGGCDHKWKVIHAVNVFDTAQSELPSGYKYHLQCEKCGELKFKMANN